MPDVVKVIRQAQLLNVCSTECAFRQCSWFVRTIRVKGDSCKREATLESISAKLCAWCQDAAVLCFALDPNAAWGTALCKHPLSTVDTPWCSDLTQHMAPHESPFRQTDDRSWNALLPYRDELLFAVAAAAGAPCGMPLTEVAAREGRAIPIHTQMPLSQRL